MTGKRVEHLLAWCCRFIAATPIRPYLHLSGWNWFLFCPLQTAHTAEWIGAVLHVSDEVLPEVSVVWNNPPTFGKHSLKKQSRTLPLFHRITYCHPCGRTSPQHSFLCVWQGHMLTLTPRGEIPASISICVCVDVSLCYVCVFPCVLRVIVCALCVRARVCVCVCACGGLIARRRHNEMGGWAGASHH